MLYNEISYMKYGYFLRFFNLIVCTYSILALENIDNWGHI